MRKELLLLIFPILVCCNNFETKKISSEEVLCQEPKSLNWREVDEYPAFENCKKILLSEYENHQVVDRLWECSKPGLKLRLRHF